MKSTMKISDLNIGNIREYIKKIYRSFEEDKRFILKTEH